MRVTVWTQRGGGDDIWTDCAYSAALQLLVAGGWRRFPLGIYTPAERNELETFDDRPDNTGVRSFADTDLAVERRYGVNLRRLADGSNAGLAKALRTPGRTFQIAGLNARFPDHLRRFSPNFAGSHAVTVTQYRASDDTLLLLDPLAPSGYAGERTPVATIVAWAHIPNDARYLLDGELARLPDTATEEEDVYQEWLPEIRWEAVRPAIVAQGATAYKAPKKEPALIHHIFRTGTTPDAMEDRTVEIMGVLIDPTGHEPGMWWVIRRGAGFRGAPSLVANSEMDDPSADAGDAQAAGDCGAAVELARATLNQEWRDRLRQLLG